VPDRLVRVGGGGAALMGYFDVHLCPLADGDAAGAPLADVLADALASDRVQR